MDREILFRGQTRKYGEKVAVGTREKLPGQWGTAPGKSAIISFLIGNAHHYDTGMLLDKLGIAVRTGHHCAQPLMQALGIEGTVRASFALYNTIEECDRFPQSIGVGHLPPQSVHPVGSTSSPARPSAQIGRAHV